MAEHVPDIPDSIVEPLMELLKHKFNEGHSSGRNAGAKKRTDAALAESSQKRLYAAIREELRLATFRRTMK